MFAIDQTQSMQRSTPTQLWAPRRAKYVKCEHSDSGLSLKVLWIGLDCSFRYIQLDTEVFVQSNDIIAI